MPGMPQVSFADGRWQISQRHGTQAYILRMREFFRVDPADWVFVLADPSGGPEVRLVTQAEYDAAREDHEINDCGTCRVTTTQYALERHTDIRVRTPAEEAILLDLSIRWRSLNIIASF